MSNLAKSRSAGRVMRYDLRVDRPGALAVTHFFDKYAREKLEVGYTWSDLVKMLEEPPIADVKQDLPWLKLARFGDRLSDRGSLRHDANVTSISGVEGDYDGEHVSPDEAARRLRARGIKSIVYTSPSHHPDRPRWRVVAPLSRPTNPSERRVHFERLNLVLGGILTSESRALSQSYYFGCLATTHYRVISIEGQHLDEVTDDSDLPVSFVEALKRDAQLREVWERGSSTGDTSRSGHDATLATMLGLGGYDDADIKTILLAYPHGQVSETRDERQITRLLDLAHHAREDRVGV